MLKTFNYNKNGASKTLEVFLNRRKFTQKKTLIEQCLRFKYIIKFNTS